MPLRADQAADTPSIARSALILTAAIAGAAVVEAALLPGIIVGAAAWFAPHALTTLRKRRIGRAPAVRRRLAPAREIEANQSRFSDITHFAITQSALKTVTFRIISSGLDFGWNYLILGEVATAASLSGVSLIAAPTFYFLHETVWNRYSRRDVPENETPAAFVISGDTRRVAISKAMAKTLTFRTFATISEFSVNYFVVRDFLMASKLSAFSIVAGPFVYIAHEKAWERYGQEATRTAAVRLLPGRPA